MPDDNTRMLNVQAGQLDTAIFVPFSRVAELQKDPNLTVHLDPSTREDHLLINHEHGALAKKEVRQALDMAIDEQAVVDTVTFGYGEVANSYVPKGALYYYADNLKRPYDPEKAKQMLADAGASDLTLNYVVRAGDEIVEQIAVLLQQQLAKAGVTVNIQKVDPSQEWDMLVAGDYDVGVNYWTNDILDPDQKTTFVLGHDANMNYMTRYNNETGQGAGRGGAHRNGSGQARADVYRPAEDGEGGRELDRSLLQPVHQRLAQEHRELLPEPAGPVLPGRRRQELGLRAKPRDAARRRSAQP